MEDKQKDIPLWVPKIDKDTERVIPRLTPETIKLLNKRGSINGHQENI